MTYLFSWTIFGSLEQLIFSNFSAQISGAKSIPNSPLQKALNKFFDQEKQTPPEN